MPKGLSSAPADSVGTLLAKFEIVLPIALGIGVTDDHDEIALQVGVVERIRHEANGPNESGKIRAELKSNCTAMVNCASFSGLIGQRCPVNAIGAGRVLDGLCRELGASGTH